MGRRVLLRFGFDEGDGHRLWTSCRDDSEGIVHSSLGLSSLGRASLSTILSLYSGDIHPIPKQVSTDIVFLASFGFDYSCRFDVNKGVPGEQ